MHQCSKWNPHHRVLNAECPAGIFSWKSQEPKDTVLLYYQKCFHQSAYSGTKVLYNSINSDIMTTSSQYIPTKCICLCARIACIYCAYLHVVQLIVSPLLCLPISALVSACVKVMTNTILASCSVNSDFMTFYLVTYDMHIIKVNWDENVVVVDDDGEAEVITCDLSAYNGA